jgi:hypothetical protein
MYAISFVGRPARPRPHIAEVGPNTDEALASRKGGQVVGGLLVTA